MAFNPTYFERPTGPQPPGIRAVYLVRVHDIEVFPYPALYDLLDEPLQLKSDAQVYQVLSLASPSTLRVDRSTDAIGRNSSWQVQVNLPGNEADNELIATSFVRQPFVVITEDLSGRTMLLGTPGQPLRSEVLQSSAGESGQRRIRITLRGEGDVPAFLYEASPPANAQQLNHIIGSNASGLREIILIPAHRVVSIPLPDENNVLRSGPDILEGTSVITLPMVGLDASYSQSIQQDEAGTYYGQEVSATIPSAVVPNIVSAYDHWVVLATDLHGVQRLIGRPDQYLTSTIQQSNDNQQRIRLRLRGETELVSHRLLSPPPRPRWMSIPEPPPPPVVEETVDFREDDFSRQDFY